MQKRLIGFICVVAFLACVCDARAAVVLAEKFGYADGSVTNVSALQWANHSGTGGQANVASGKLVLTEAESEDINARLDGRPYATNSLAVLYASFVLNCTALPSGTGGYFAHFKDDTTSGFRGRVFSSTAGAAVGQFRLGVAAAAGTPSATLATDLSLNTDYRVVVRYAVATGVSTLWVNPSSEADPGVTSTDAAALLPVTSIAFRQSLSGGNGIGSMTVDDLMVATSFAELTGPVVVENPARIVVEPVDQKVAAGLVASFGVTATGDAPLVYQWYLNGKPIAGAEAAIYRIEAVQSVHEGAYTVVVRNASGSVTSQAATLSLQAPAGPVVSTIAALRALVDPQTFAPTNTTELFVAEGVVTTHVNVTTDANALFYIQDTTAGIAVFVSGGSAIRPKAGDRVRVTGPLGHFNGLLELNLVASNPQHKVETLSSGNPLPTPKPLAFSAQGDPATMEALEGSVVVASGVLLDLAQANFPSATSGGNVTMSNEAGEKFVLRVDARVLDITGQPKPTVPVSVIGVLAQFDGSSPYTTGYQLTPTRFGDIQGGVVAPKIEFTHGLELLRAGDAPTNTFTEIVLLPGERVSTLVRATSPDGAMVTVTTRAEGLPSGATWSLERAQATNVTGRFSYQATASEAGRRFEIALSAANAQATNTVVWTIYVPTPSEQRITIGEFHANPPSTVVEPYPNLLSRTGVPGAPGSDDEWVELVSLADTDTDLLGWTISDSVQVRHRFYETFRIGTSNAVVVYGGPLNAFAPQLDVPSIPASENAFGFGLNNTGGDSIWLRNAQSNLVSRVVYSTLSTNGTMTRFPNLEGAFVAHTSVATKAASPGRQFNGEPFSVSALVTPKAPKLEAAALTSAGVRLRWDARVGSSYSVHRADSVSAVFAPIATGLTSGAGVVEFVDPIGAGTQHRFYRISTP